MPSYNNAYTSICLPSDFCQRPWSPSWLCHINVIASIVGCNFKLFIIQPLFIISTTPTIRIQVGTCTTTAPYQSLSSFDSLLSMQQSGWSHPWNQKSEKGICYVATLLTQGTCQSCPCARRSYSSSMLPAPWFSSNNHWASPSFHKILQASPPPLALWGHPWTPI